LEQEFHHLTKRMEGDKLTAALVLAQYKGLQDFLTGCHPKYPEANIKKILKKNVRQDTKIFK
jgi:glutamine amidotransferase-like uncharacterized protein